MKQKYKRVLTQALALGMTLVMTVQMLPTQALAVEYQTAQMDKKIEDLREEVADLEQQAEELLGYSLQDVYSSSEDTTWNAYSSPALLTSTGDVAEISDESAFAFDAATGTVTGFADDFTAPSGYYSVSIPSTIGDVEVTAIGGYAFDGDLELKGVTLPDSIKTIGNNTFQNCTFLESMTLPDDLETIGNYAFENTVNLTGITELPASVTSIGYRAFSRSGAQFTGMDLSNVETVGDYAFVSNTALEEVILPADISGYGSGVFSGCTALTTVTFAEGAAPEAIPDSMFNDCTALADFELPESVTSIGNCAFQNCALLEGIELSGVTEIGYSAFEGCKALTEITLNENVVLNSGAFAATGLVNVTLPDSITELPDELFEDCTRLVSVTANALTQIGSSAFDGCTSLPELPDLSQVTSIGAYAFVGTAVTELDLYATEHDLLLGYGIVADCANLKKITLHGNYKAKGEAIANDWARPFSGTSEDLTFVFDGRPTAIGSGLFQDAPFVKDLDFIPDSVTEYWEFSFAGTPLTEITIPERITNIKAGVFSACESLVKVTVLNDIRAWKTLYAYEYDTAWGNQGIFKMGFFVDTPMADLTVAGDKADITFPEDWDSIPYGFFAGSDIRDTEFLTKMPNLKEIEAYAFNYCDKLENLVIPEGVETIDYRAFYESMGKVKVLTIPASVTALKARTSSSSATQYTQHFYNPYSSALTDVYIHNPNLDLHASDFNYNYQSSGYVKRVFPTYSYSTENPLRIHGAVNSDGTSTAKDLCDASGGLYTFVPLGTIGKLSLTVMAGEKDVTDLVDIEWKNAGGIVQSAGPDLYPHDVGISYTYTLTLPQWLLADYAVPEVGTVTSGTNAQNIVVELDPIPAAAFTIEVPEDAYVELTQQVNGMEIDYAAYPNETGSVTFDAKQAYTEVFAFREGFYARAAVLEAPAESNTIDFTSGWQSLPATAVTVTASSLLDGVETAVADLSAFTFTVKNNSGTVVPTTLQGGILYPADAESEMTADEQLTLEVSVPESSDLIAPDAPISFTFADGAVHIPFTARGHIRMEVSNWSASDTDGFHLWIFDQESGDLVDAYTMYYGFCETEPLPQGTYTVVAIDASVGIRSVPNISALSAFGLSGTTHYTKKAADVSNGNVTVLGELDVPDYETFGGALYVDMFESTAFDSTVLEPVIGQSFILTFDYAINGTYASGGEKQILLQLPAGTRLDRCYPPEGLGSYAYDEASGLLSVTTTVNEGQIYLSLMGKKADNSGSVTATAKIGAYTAKPVSLPLPIKDMYIEAYDVVDGDMIDRKITVHAGKNATVMLYVNGEPYQVTYSDGSLNVGSSRPADSSGKAEFAVTLPGPASPGTRWELTATATVWDGYENMTYESQSVKVITCSPDPFHVHVGTQKPWCYDLPGGRIDFHSVDGATRAYWMTYCKHYTWGASVAPGMGKYIKDGTIYLKLSLFRDGPVTYLPLKATRSGGDTFAATTSDIISHGYIDYYFDVTDEYYTEYLGQPVPVEEDVVTERGAIFAEEIEELEALSEYRIELTEEEMSELTAEDRAAELSFQAALRNLRLTFAEYIPDLDMDTASDAEVLEAMGITVRDLEPGELDGYANNMDFTTIEVKNADDSTTIQYTYADQTKSIVVDAAAGTITTMDYTAMQQNAQTYALKRTSRSGTETAQSILQEASNTVSDVSKQVSNLESLIDAIENSLEEYNTSSLWDKIRKADAADVCGLAKKVLSKAITIFNFFEWGSMIGEGFSLNAMSDAAMAEWEQIRQNGGEGLADPTACMKVLENLATAYGDLATAIAYKVLYLTAQLVMVIGSIATALPSGGISILVSLLAMLATTVIDAAFDANIDRARQSVDRWLKQKSYACRPDEDESEDDVPCRSYMDPSGYVYEAVFSNPVEGLEVTAHMKERENSEAVVWDATEFGQENPLTTNGVGFYRWDVPAGYWNVVVSENADYHAASSAAVYSEEHMREGRTDITADGWHQVLPIQTEVHIPVVSKHAPIVDEENTIPWSDGILVQFSQYMKEETVKGNVTVTMGSQTFTGEDLVITWPDQELSDHYYNRTFASQLMIARADGETWLDEVTITIGGGENYAGTALSTWTETMDVVPVIAEIDSVEAVEVEAEESTTVTLTLRDASGNAIPGVPVTLSTGLYATLPGGGNNENRTLEAASDPNGQITVTVQGHYPGEDLLSIAIPGRSGTWSIPIQIGSAAPLVAEPVVTINGVNYSGQGHVVTVEKGTVITVTGTYGDDLWYSIGESTCPCTESEQLYVRSGQLEITESGYYKFAAERDGVYSSRVHITIQVTVPAVHELVVSLPSLTPRTNDVPYDLTIESINGGTDKLEKFDELYVEERRSSNGGTYWTWYDWRRSDQQSADNLNGYYSMMMYKPVGDNVNPSYQFVSGAHYALIVQLPLGEEYADMPVARDCVLVLTSPIGEQRLTGEIVTEYSQDYLQFAVYYEKSTLLPEAQSYTNTLVENSDIGYISTEPGYWNAIKEGTVVTVTTWPYSEYWNTKAVSVTLADGTPVAVTREDETTFTFIQPDGAVTISAEYGPISDETFSVTVNQPDHGTITVSPAEPQVAGTEITVTVAVPEGYKLNDWNPITVTDSTGETLSYWEDWSDGEDKRYCFEMPLGGATVSAAVKPITYDIYPWVGDIDGNDCDYGTITVTPEEAVLGETVTVTVTADEGYLLGYLDIYYSYWDNDIEKWVYPEVDYTYTGEDGVYTFTQPHSPDGYVNVYAYLIAERDRTVTVTQPANGSITVSPLQPYPEEEVKIKVEPDDGYEVTGVTVTDSSGEPVDVTKEADGTYTYTQPEGIVSISAVLESQSGTHTHVFDKQVVDETYLMSEADCEHPAVYYFSCTCGEMGPDTFPYGEAPGHTPGTAWEKDGTHHWHTCTVSGCGAVIQSSLATHTPDHEGGATEEYPIKCTQCGYVMEQQLAHTHVFDKQVIDETYLMSEADCEHPAVYYFSCACGEMGTDTFPYGEAPGHTPGTAWEKDGTHHWHTCTVSGCGAVIQSSLATHTPDHEGGATEEYPIKCTQCGYVMEQQLAHTHVFDKQVVDETYLMSEADCEHPAVYYFSCTCGEMGPDTFPYGSAPGHTPATAWEKDDTHHWHTCTVSGCGAVIQSSLATHTPDHAGGATEEYPIKCTQCGYVMEQQLAHTHVFDKQVVDETYLMSEADCENAAMYYLSCACGEMGTETFPYGSAPGHTPATAWEKDDTHHWHICTVSGCGAVIQSSLATHTPDHEGGATEEYPIKCTQCGYVMEQQLAHTHVFDKQVVDETYLMSEADCENAAMYYLSCACGEMGTETFPYGSALGHTHSQDWKKDRTNHWHECSCGNKADTAAHEYGSDSTCDVCGYRKSSGGSSGGGAAADVAYALAVTQPENGSITVSPAKAEAGDTVTITVTPDKGYTLETLTVADKNGKEVKITAKGSKYTFTMPASKVTIQATFMEDNTMLNFFVDVPATAYYYDAVLWAVRSGITSGTTATTFSPDATCTRAQAVTFLWRAAGSPDVEGELVFTDVAENAYYYDAVLWAVKEGITSGTSATTFSPDTTCTRAQIGTFLWRSAGSFEAGNADMQFADVAENAYYYDAVLWAVEEGITSGTSATTFSPDEGCTRAQIVTFLWKKSSK